MPRPSMKKNLPTQANFSDSHYILMNAPIGIFTSTPDGRYISINPALARMYGYDSPEELIESVTDIAEQVYVDPSDREDFIRLMKEPGEVVNHESRRLCRDGTVFWVSMNARALRDNSGKVIAYQGFYQDITKRKLAEQALRKSEEKYRVLFENTSEAMFVTQDGRIVFFNPRTVVLSGYSENELLSRPFTDFVHQEDREMAMHRHIRRLRGEYLPERYAARVLHSDGSILWVEIKGMLIQWNGKPATLNFLSDITERKQAEEALRRSENLFRKIFEILPIGLWIADKKGKLIQGNPAGVAIWGAQPNVGQREYEVFKARRLPSGEQIAPDDWALAHTVNKGETIVDELLEIDALDGKKKIILNYTTPILDSSGQVEGAIVVNQDITERKMIEKQLKFLSFNDQLTNLYNRTCFEYEMQRLSKSREHPITVVCMDVDGLKMVNDTLGHDQGDKILKQCADLLRDVFRKSDIVARTGGDEFAALLPKTDKQAGQKIVRRIRTVIDEFNQQAKPNQIPLSISIGMSVAENADSELSSVFKDADDLMYRDKLSKDVTHRSRIMRSLLAALEERDFMSRDSAQRMEDLCRLVGKKIDLSEKQLSDLALLVHLHDIGNAGVPDHILFKQGPLTEEEWQIIYQHPEKGHRIAKASIDLAGTGDLILRHHERWDGEGYPLGLEGKEIPIECRVFSFIDAYDAMTSDRPYRKARSSAEALEEIRKFSGTQFDPELAEIFLEVLDYNDELGKQNQTN